MELGLFYQTGFRYVAAYNAIKKFRNFYPTSPIAMYEDNSFVMEPIAKKFNCSYSRTKLFGRNDPNSGRPAFNLDTTKGWLDRVYEACTTTLSEVDWIMNFEDDVWFIREIVGEPPFDLSGIGGYGWDKELYDYLSTEAIGSHGCGGSIFNRLKFIEAYENAKTINWELVDQLAKNPKPSEWTDSALTLIFLYSKFSVGGWSELAQYKNSEAETLCDRRGWLGTIEELESKQNGVAVVHCWKPYYYPSHDEVELVNLELIKYQ
jgi:hypothetical protein